MEIEKNDVIISGEGPPLLLLHGWPFHRENYRKVIPLLSQQFTCYALNSLGMTGREIPPGADMGFCAHAKRAADLMKQLGVETYSILAHDTGATIARIMAAEYPKSVQALALLNTEIPGHRPPFIPLYRNLSFLPGFRTNLKLLMKSKTYLRSPMGFGGCFSDKNFIDEEFVALFGTYWTQNKIRFTGMIKYLQGIDFSIVDDLDNIHTKIQCPVHFIWGEDDPTFPVDQGRAMADQMDALSSFETVANAKFLLHEERPDETARLVKNALLS